MDLLRTLRYILHLEAFQDTKPACLPCRRWDLEYSNRELTFKGVWVNSTAVFVGSSYREESGLTETPCV